MNLKKSMSKKNLGYLFHYKNLITHQLHGKEQEKTWAKKFEIIFQSHEQNFENFKASFMTTTSWKKTKPIVA